MIDIAPYAIGDETALEVQPAQLAQPRHPIPVMVSRGPAWTVRSCEGEGRVLGIGGFVINHPGYATAWASFASAKRTALVPIVRVIAYELRRAADLYARVDLIVAGDFEPGHRLALDLGMTPEATLHAAGTSGEDMVLWARTNRKER